MARYPYREVIEPNSTGLSIERVAYLCGVGVCKAGNVLGAARRLGIGWPVPAELGGEELERLVDPLEGARRCRPDFPAIAKALGTERLRPRRAQEAYDLYLEMSRGGDKEPYAFWTFKKHMGRWNSTGRRSRRCSSTGTWARRCRSITLTGSCGCTGPTARRSRRSCSWRPCPTRTSRSCGRRSTWGCRPGWSNMRMFEYLGGVPIFIGADNLATGVTHVGNIVDALP